LFEVKKQTSTIAVYWNLAVTHYRNYVFNVPWNIHF